MKVSVDSWYKAKTNQGSVIKVCYFAEGDKKPKDVVILEEDYLEWIADNNLDGEVDANDWDEREMDYAPSKTVVDHNENMYENLAEYIKEKYVSNA